MNEILKIVINLIGRYIVREIILGGKEISFYDLIVFVIDYIKNKFIQK